MNNQNELTEQKALQLLADGERIVECKENPSGRFIAYHPITPELATKLMLNGKITKTGETKFHKFYGLKRVEVFGTEYVNSPLGIVHRDTFEAIFNGGNSTPFACED